MNLEVLLQKFATSEISRSIIDWADNIMLDEQLYLQNMQGSSFSFHFANFYNHSISTQWNHIIICADSEEAIYMQNDFENIFNPADLFYFPSSFKHKKNYSLLNSSHTMLRSEALTKISAGGNKKILITYPEALFEKVVISKTLEKNIILLKQGDTIDVNSILEKFVTLGFSRSDFVYEPGQFALRGGILDIYTYGNEKPYRVELYGNDIESIRMFNPETQLSERKLLQVRIIPNVSTQFEERERINILDFFTDNTIVWIKDPIFVEEKLEQEQENLNIFMDAVFTNTNENIEDEKLIPTKELFITPQDWIEKLKNFKQIITGNIVKKETKNIIIKKAKQIQQPSFNRNFSMLIAKLKEYELKNYVSFIFAENPRQLERLTSIFADLKAEVQFTAIAADIHTGFIDDELKIICFTDHQIFQRYHKYKVKQAYNKNKAITLKTLRELQPGDYVSHIDHGVGVYSGLEKININGRLQESVRLVFKDKDLLYVNIASLHKISKYSGKEGSIPKMNKLGSDTWSKLKEKTTKQVRDIATDLIKLYAERKAQVGFAHSPDNYLQTELEASFIYEDTPDQSKATIDVKTDMEKNMPMDRLVCGDVGFGKTEIAIRAAFKSVCDSKQAAVLVPTTILAYQHYKTFSERLKDFPVTVDYINRFKTAKEKKETLAKVADGKVDIIIGTHSLLGKDMKFKDLGVMIIDEEQKFGVSAKEKLKKIRTTVDSLTLTATPIPRTLQFSLMGARDLSIINTPPPNRQPIQTELRIFNEDEIRDAIYYETERGGQVFFIHNRVKDLLQMKAILNALCPDLSITSAHGQMEGDQLEETILDFMDKRYDVLICTNIVESGVDIPNVNTIIINNAHHFGLSDLHQLRGRVGRSNKKAFCYLLAPSISTLPSDSRKRLQTLEQYSDLGSGFQIAMRDLDIRGAGNLLGSEQSGFISEIGFEMYHKILDEAIRKLKRTEFKALFKEEIAAQDDFVSDCTIDTDLEILIPDDYVESITERLNLYTRLDNCKDKEELEHLHTEMIDRFGAIPNSVEDLFKTVRCRKIAVRIGFEKMIIKDDVLKCFFVNNPESPYFQSKTFSLLLSFLQTETNKGKLKQTGKIFLLVVTDIKSMENLELFLSKVDKFLEY